MNKARKVAIVTGASQGIGATLVQALSSRDYLVVANSRSIKAVDDSGLVAVPGDVADPQTAGQVVREALNRFGRIDTLVNNAGIFIAKPFTAYSKDDYPGLSGNERHRLLSHDAERD
jgi:NAD(P)-dependent dehydrogenase (short-subunit alcohol dehydrogenase family)